MPCVSFAAACSRIGAGNIEPANTIARSDETSLLATAAKMRPTLVVADLALAQGESFGWLRRLLARCPGTRVIVLSSHDESIVVNEAFEAGAVGFVRKREIATGLHAAVEAVLAGDRYSPRPQSEPGA